MSRTIVFVVLYFLLSNSIGAQPTIDGAFSNNEWPLPVATSDQVDGWAGVSVKNLYVTHDATYLYIGLEASGTADWQSYGIAINTLDSHGGANEVWQFPITYGHSELPDFVVKGHFGQSTTPYAEIRKWDVDSWEQINNDGQASGLSSADFSSDESDFLEFRVRKSILGFPDHIDIQAYISGDNGNEHATFDACPDDENADNWNDATVLDEYVANLDLTSNPIVDVNPPYPDEMETVTVSFNADGTPLEGSNKIYIHAGISTDIDDVLAFSKVIGNWGQDDGIGEMSNIGPNLWEFSFSSLASYFQVDITEDIFGLNFLFRNADGSVVEDDGGQNYSNLVDPGNHISINEPNATNSFIPVQEDFEVKFESSPIPSVWTLEEVDDMNQVISVVSSGSGSATFSALISSANARVTRYKISADFPEEVRYKFFEVTYFEAVSEAPRPSWTRPGINYHEDDPTKVTLVLHAPTYTRFYQHPASGPVITGTNPTVSKEVVHVIGDFNNWQATEASKMKRDRDGWDPETEIDSDGDGDRGDYWWIELNNLTPGQSYIFQYLIDGSIHIADPYTEQVSDPDDAFISNNRNSDLLPYPSQAVDRASVLQTNQSTFNWEASAFTKPSINKLNIYELHFRDFTEEGTYKAAEGRLDYLKALGINAIHVMPVSEFEGNSSWGYNPNFYFAPDKYYGTAEELKSFIDQCHMREIQVFNDLVLNHAFYSNVMARMYWNEESNQPADDSPYFNPEHKMVAEPTGWWGADWNHESEHTQEMVDRVLDFWLQEYKFDGFRFDFTKGFGQSPQDPSDPWASSYDQNRIDLLLRMVNGMKSRNPGSVAIFEHLANANEDAVLADQGILMWSGAGHHGDIKEFMLGWNGRDIYNSGIYIAQGFSFANWMSYMESHDEERQAYEVKEFAKNHESFDTEDIIDRLKIGAVFNLLFPGPRMIWQFEEIAYDFSINYNGRTGEKPVRWDYYEDGKRRELWRLFSILFHLRNEYDLYAGSTDYGNIGSNDGVQTGRRMALNDGQNKQVIAVVNLDPDNSIVINPGYNNNGIWYRYNGDPLIDGTSYNVSSINESYTLAPSESLILTNFDINWTDDCSLAESCCIQEVFTWIAEEGNWHDPVNWDHGLVPSACDMIVLPTGSHVIISEGTSAYTRYIWGLEGSTLDVQGELVVTKK